jgi:four helix bundle suffix protein
VVFCDRFIDKRSRTHDQMVQAARSGVQNIAEGSVASGTSKKTEIKLTNVAKASLEELLLDYSDFLRQRGLRLWEKDGPEAMAVRTRYQAEGAAGSDLCGVHSANAESTANTLICLINQTTFLLGRQLLALERQFLEQGGFTERLHTMRVNRRQSNQSNPVPMPSDAESVEKSASFGKQQSPIPMCPVCGKQMVSRTARQGSGAGKSFWGCSGYPECKATRNA